MSGESGTDRQSRSTATWYATGVETAGVSIDVIGTDSMDVPGSEPEYMVWDPACLHSTRE